MKHCVKPILVTGSHRSGTTWVGQILAKAPHTAYMLEPFNLGIKLGVTKKIFKYWFQHIATENEIYYKKQMDDFFDYKYPLVENIRKLKAYSDAKHIFNEQVRFLRHKSKNDALIFKDPIAFFSADWLAKTYKMNVLLMIRHPAAFCSSLKIANWKFDFNNFTKQPILMRQYLAKFESEIFEYAENEKNVIDQAILLWNCIHHTISIYQENHSDWFFLRHEDVSRDPVTQFKSIYKKFDLEFTPPVLSAILETSGSHNPVEQQSRVEVYRNSQKNILNWKNRLSQHEIALIKEKTAGVSSLFYSEDDW